MSGCGDLVADAGNGVAPALRAVDCMSGQLSTSAFDRLLGAHGALLPALTVVLTLYIALFALALLAGRTRLGIGALSGKMMSLGLVLAFATSWAAYQNVVWTLATGAPDEIAGMVMGTKGSATQIFVGRIDILFAAIAEINDNASQQAAQAAAENAPQNGAPASAAKPAATAAPGVSPANLLWLGATVLLLGTVGVLVTARIILALMLALGPVFVVLALFPATRGLFAGWLRATVLAGIAPLLAVIGGAFTLELAVPVVNRLAGPDGIDARGAMAFFLIAAVHATLMVMALRTCATIVGAWQVFPTGRDWRSAPAAAHSQFIASAPAAALPWLAPGRMGAAPGGSPLALPPTSDAGAAPTGSSRTRLVVAPSLAGHDPMRGAFGQDGGRRASGIGSRFRTPPPRQRLA